MRARDRDDVPPFAGARHGVERGLVGIGDGRGERAERMLHRFAELPDGTLVWTRTGEGAYRLGRVAGPLRRDDSEAARRVGIHNVRAATWLGRELAGDEVPDAVVATFARGGRNLQRTHDEDAERVSAELWEAGAG
jgi:hypothetical protein